MDGGADVLVTKIDEEIMRKIPFGFAACYVLLLHGCANLNTVHRSLDLGDKKSSQAIAIDGYQLPIFSQTVSLRKTPNGTDPFDENGDRTAFIVCPNPPVEAISGNNLSAALTNSFKAGQQAKAAGATNDTQAALASAVAAASIGLRTNSTTLLSYSATANCLAYMGGATHDKKYMELARRNQHITLAILAIEQLTGVAQAGQATLNGSGSSATGAENLAPLQKSLDDAIKDHNAAVASEKSALDDLRAAEKDRVEKLAQRRDANAANQTAKNDPKVEAQAKADAKAALDSAEKAYALAVESSAAASRTADAATQESSRTDSVVKHAQVALELAERAVRAQVTASSTVGQGQGPRASATAEVARAVVDVVKVVTAAIGEGESCAAIIEDFRISDDARLKARWSTPAGQSILQACAVERAVGAANRENVAASQALGGDVTVALAQIMSRTDGIANPVRESEQKKVPATAPKGAEKSKRPASGSSGNNRPQQFLKNFNGTNVFSEIGKTIGQEPDAPNPQSPNKVD